MKLPLEVLFLINLENFNIFVIKYYKIVTLPYIEHKFLYNKNINIINSWKNLIRTFWFKFLIIVGVIDLALVLHSFYDVYWAEFYIFAFHLLAPLYLLLKTILILLIIFLLMFPYFKSWGLNGVIENYQEFFSN